MSALIAKIRQEQEDERRRKEGLALETDKFDEDGFDEMVSRSIYLLHRDITRKKEHEKYNSWCMEILEHLETMYDMSDIESDFSVFCHYVYRNSC
jgi:hypothetical protein